jgi:hypothetical protein
VNKGKEKRKGRGGKASASYSLSERNAVLTFTATLGKTAPKLDLAFA